MAKRQRRYTTAQVIGNKVILAGKKGNIVLKGGQVTEGKIVGVEGDYLLLKNGLQQTQRFLLDSIEEVIVETHT